MISATGIVKKFRQRGHTLDGREVMALRGVDLTIPRGGAVSLIGESGCGKTTLGRILAGLETYDEGEIALDGTKLSSLSRRARERESRKIQLIHQDPYTALNSTRTVHQALHDPLRMYAKRAGKPKSWMYGRAEEVLSLVGLDPAYVLPRYPHQLSGGMRQRVVIARALTVEPEMLIADEAVSMIDVSLRLGVLSLLRDLRERLGVSVLYITHDVATARYIGEDSVISVIYRGQVVEQGPTETVIAEPVHPYTQSLLSAIPVLHGVEIPGEEQVKPLATGAVDAQDAEGGHAGGAEVDSCLFVDRCPFADATCRSAFPELGKASEQLQDDGRLHACFHPKRRQVAARAAE